MQINISNEQDILDLDEDVLISIVKKILEYENASCDELSLYFINDERISRLHERYFDDPTPTDCISFPIDSKDEEGYRVLGEVFISCETAKTYATENGLSPFKETILYVIHGILHLLGYDDISENDQKIMRKKEESCIHYLQEANLLDTKTACKTQISYLTLLS